MALFSLVSMVVFLSLVLMFGFGMRIKGGIAEVGLLALGADIGAFVAIFAAPPDPLFFVSLYFVEGVVGHSS